MFDVLFLQLNTFQCVIATDGSMSFAIFLYNETEWSTQNDPDDPSLETSPAKIGFNEGIIIILQIQSHILATFFINSMFCQEFSTNHGKFRVQGAAM